MLRYIPKFWVWVQIRAEASLGNLKPWAEASQNPTNRQTDGTVSTPLTSRRASYMIRTRVYGLKAIFCKKLCFPSSFWFLTSKEFCRRLHTLQAMKTNQEKIPSPAPPWSRQMARHDLRSLPMTNSRTSCEARAGR